MGRPSAQKRKVRRNKKKKIRLGAGGHEGAQFMIDAKC